MNDHLTQYEIENSVAYYGERLQKFDRALEGMRTWQLSPDQEKREARQQIITFIWELEDKIRLLMLQYKEAGDE